MSFDYQKAREELDPEHPENYCECEIRDLLSGALDRIDELEKQNADLLERGQLNIEAHDNLLRQVADLEGELRQAAEKFDDQATVIRDLRERLAVAEKMGRELEGWLIEAEAKLFAGCDYDGHQIEPQKEDYVRATAQLLAEGKLKEAPQ